VVYWVEVIGDKIATGKEATKRGCWTAGPTRGTAQAVDLPDGDGGRQFAELSKRKKAGRRLLGKGAHPQQHNGRIDGNLLGKKKKK